MPQLAGDDNIVLIGMPGVGKSTVGVLLAKALSRDFVDTDVLIQSREGRRLQDLLDDEGASAFCAMEERHILALRSRGAVIATGGSVVYRDRAMRHLRGDGVVVHLDLALPAVEARLVDIDSRGVVMPAGRTVASLYEERMPLYRRYADVTIDCAGCSHEQVVAAIIAALTT